MELKWIKTRFDQNREDWDLRTSDNRKLVGFFVDVEHEPIPLWWWMDREQDSAHQLTGMTYKEAKAVVEAMARLEG